MKRSSDSSFRLKSRIVLVSFSINNRELMHFSYSRYLENKIRESFGFEGTSIKFVFREKGDNA
ncbi:MAG: hypothetical protein IKF70_05235 [Firmicutes bacterium]|nr:hypothetical protein [Bacillota bacterium]